MTNFTKILIVIKIIIIGKVLTRDTFETNSIKRKTWEFTDFNLPLDQGVCIWIAMYAPQYKPKDAKKLN